MDFAPLYRFSEITWIFFFLNMQNRSVLEYLLCENNYLRGINIIDFLADKNLQRTFSIDGWMDGMGFNATFSSISAISWQSVLLVEETGVPRENHRPWAAN